MPGIWPDWKEAMFAGVAIHLCHRCARLLRAMGAAARHRRAEQQLFALDARVLRDMGVARDQIGSLVRPPETAKPERSQAPMVLGEALNRN